MERRGDDERIRQAMAALLPGARIVSLEVLANDVAGGVAQKRAGYGRPVRVIVEDEDGTRRSVVLRTAVANEFGHERRADRVAELLLAYDTFGAIPDHVRPLDFGVFTPDGPRSLRDGGEPYLVTTFAEGRRYVEDLRRIARDGTATSRDVERCEALALWLARLHEERLDDAVGWRRAIRDLVGHGEGIFGIVDAYAADTPAAPPARLAAIERRCVDWRWRLRAEADRARRTHGDFHPFNILFSEGTRFTLLDASRGCAGDPADDVAALAINYVFFALQAPGSWPRGFAPLWRRFFGAYFEAGGSRTVLDRIPPFLAWRALVVCCPRFYPDVSPAVREALLGLAERALDSPPFDPHDAEVLF